MPVEPWLLAAGVLFLLGHVVILLFFYRLRQGAGQSEPDANGVDAVSCQECGAENDGQYQFCRECAAELPGGLAVSGDGNAPESRGML